MKRLLAVVVIAVALSGCVSNEDVAHYSNIDLIKCSVSNASPNGLWDDSDGKCIAELENRIHEGKVSQQELAVGKAGGAATASEGGAGAIAGAIYSRPAIGGWYY